MIVALVVVVGLTIAVSVASRSVTTVSVSTQEEERSRSFSAAEAGVEDALRQNLSTIAGGALPTLTVGESSVQVRVSQVASVSTEIAPGEVVTIDWNKSDPGLSSISVSWTGNGCSPQLVSTSITPSGSADHLVSTTSPQSFSRGAGGLIRLRVVGCSGTLAIDGIGNALSFYEIDSTGISGDARSRIQVTRSEASAIGLMDFAVFSGGDVQ